MARTRRSRDEPPTCHPDRPHQAKGLCPQCYMRDYDERRKGRVDRRKDPQDYAPNYRKPPTQERRNAACHAERDHYSRGLCRPCYQKARRNGELPTERATCHPERAATARGLCSQCYSQQNYWNNPEAFRQKARDRQSLARKLLRDEMIRAYGGRCSCQWCTETISDFLTLDHVNGDGKAHRKLVGSHTYADLRRKGWPQDGYRLLCWNCNAMTRYGRACPHEHN